MTHGEYWGAATTGPVDGIADAWAWVTSSDAASGGVALGGTLLACLVIAVIVSMRRRSRL